MVGSLLLACLAAAPAGAQAEADEAGAASQPQSRLSVHAFFNQAWAKSDGPFIEGITGEGTTDYRTLALQFRYAITLDDTLVVQLQHETRGESPLDDTREEIEVDWAFYEHRFNDSAGLRLGRVRIPLGIYNEVRDVGTLLPFFEPPEGIYSDGLFTQESLDGAAFYQHFDLAKAWRVTLDGYYGEWENTILPPTQFDVAEYRAKDGAGLQLWLETPVDGLRLGLSGLRYNVNIPALTQGEEDHRKVFMASVDANLKRWILRAEYMHASFLLQTGGGSFFDDSSYSTYYGQVGYRLNDRWTLWAQYDVADVNLSDSSPFIPDIDFQLHEDLALSVTFAPRSEVMFKGEIHSADGFVGFEPGVNPFRDPPVETEYGLLSVAVAF